MKVTTTPVKCPACEGSGEVNDSKCPACNGTCVLYITETDTSGWYLPWKPLEVKPVDPWSIDPWYNPDPPYISVYVLVRYSKQ